MKKLIVAFVFVCAAVVAQAATTNWKMSASNIIGSGNVDGSTYSGSAILQYLAGSTWTDVGYTATVSDGKITLSTNTFSSDLFTAATDYDFRFVIKDGGAEFISNVATVTAQLADTASIKFGSQAGTTWSGSAVPEPTSGLLFLLGVAGLALKRKRA